jgi:hypothetical protein
MGFDHLYGSGPQSESGTGTCVESRCLVEAVLILMDHRPLKTGAKTSRKILGIEYRNGQEGDDPQKKDATPYKEEKHKGDRHGQRVSAGFCHEESKQTTTQSQKKKESPGKSQPLHHEKGDHDEKIVRIECPHLVGLLGNAGEPDQMMGHSVDAMFLKCAESDDHKGHDHEGDEKPSFFLGFHEIGDNEENQEWIKPALVVHEGGERSESGGGDIGVDDRKCSKYAKKNDQPAEGSLSRQDRQGISPLGDGANGYKTEKHDDGGKVQAGDGSSEISGDGL